MSKLVNGILLAVFLVLTAVAIATLAYVEMSRERTPQCDNIENADIKNASLAACVGFLVASALVAISYYFSFKRAVAGGDQYVGYGGYGISSNPDSIDGKFEIIVIFLFFMATFILSAILVNYVIKVKDSTKNIDKNDEFAMDESCGGFADDLFNNMAIAGASILLGFSFIAMCYPYGFKVVDMIYTSIKESPYFNRERNVST